MVKIVELRSQVERLLSHEISLHEFARWFVPYSWNAHLDSNHDAEELAEQIDDLLVEFDGDSLELHAALVALVTIPNTSVSVSFGEAISVSVSSTASADGRVEQLQFGAGHERTVLCPVTPQTNTDLGLQLELSLT